MSSYIRTVRDHGRGIPSIGWTVKYLLAVCLFGLCVFGVAYPQNNEPIKKEGLLRALRIGGVSSKELIHFVKKHGVDFQVTLADEKGIRRAGKNLGKKGLDHLVEAVRNNYRAPTSYAQTIPTPSTSIDLPLSFLNEITFRGGSPQRLDALMIAAGYTGPPAMAALIVISNEANENEVIVGTRPDLNAKNSARLLGGTDYFNFPGGENTTRVYIFSVKDGKIDVTYRPRSVSSSTQPEFAQPELPVEKIITATEVISSRRQDFPFGLRITIQSNVTISPVHFTVGCSGPIGDADAHPVSTFGGIAMQSVTTAIQGNRYEFAWESPPLTPQRPINVELFSTAPIKDCRVLRHNN